MTRPFLIPAPTSGQPAPMPVVPVLPPPQGAPPRRGLLACLSAGVLPLPVAAAPDAATPASTEADGALLARCARWHREEDEEERLDDEIEAVEERGDLAGAWRMRRRRGAARGHLWPETHAIFATVPRTPAGLRAQATVLRRLYRFGDSDEAVIATNFAEHVLGLLTGGAA